VGTRQGQAKKLDSPLARGACVVGVAVPNGGGRCGERLRQRQAGDLFSVECFCL
jgi:hypothetical protein